ncbi:hypothetical protein V8F06_006042 [Rhypophila decipiens]
MTQIQSRKPVIHPLWCCAPAGAEKRWQLTSSGRLHSNLIVIGHGIMSVSSSDVHSHPSSPPREHRRSRHHKSVRVCLPPTCPYTTGNQPWARGKSHLVTPILQVLYSALGAPAIAVAVAVASLLSKHSTRATICVVRNTVVISSQPSARFIRTAATDAPVEARVGGTTVMNPQWTLWAEAVSISVSLRRLGRHDGRMTYYGSTETRSRAVGRCGQSTRSICALANWLLAAATAIYLIPRQLLRDGYLRMQRNQEKFQIWRVGPW